MSRTLRESLNNGNPNSLGPAMEQLGAGEAFSLAPHAIRGAVGTVTAHVLTLPEGRKAVKVLRCYALGGTSGFCTPIADGSNAVPATTQVKVRATGDLEFAAADAITAAYVTYLSTDGEVIEETVDVASDLATLLSGRRCAVLIEAEALAGTATGDFTPIFAPSTPATLQAAINGDDDQKIEFAAADAVTSARIKYLAMAGEGTGVRASVTGQLETSVDYV